MSSINFATKEISVKIVFYGPGLCGKTTTLQSIYNAIKPERRPQMVSLATDVDRTIYFDFLPVNAYKIGDFIVRLQLYTVPGQVFYNSTRKLVLNGVDGVVFVVDSQPQAIDDNRESFMNLSDNLTELGMSIERVPYVMQYNKRDLPNISTVETLNAELNQAGAPAFSTVALTGEGVQDVLKSISRRVITDLTNKGVGKKVLGQEGASWGAGAPKTAQPSLEAAINTVAPAPVGITFSSLWPTPELRARCRDIEASIAKNDFTAAVLSTWTICAEATAHASDPTVEMLLRGVSGPRFIRFRDIVGRAKKGDAITLSEALFALHTALDLCF
jgi:signal recognition particle receptor subunit beta